MPAEDKGGLSVSEKEAQSPVVPEVGRESCAPSHDTGSLGPGATWGLSLALLLPAVCEVLLCPSSLFPFLILWLSWFQLVSVICK